jgi:DNA-binding response OmpR family regulator
MKKKVLVVDDSELVLAVTRETLEKAGFEVFGALDADDADRYIFSQDRPDLIVMDVMLPLFDGDMKAKKLKENELSRDIPILLLSSKPEEELRRMMKESGADGFIRKPFTDREMVAKIEETIREKGRKRILVVDDSETVLAVTRDALENAGFSAVGALDADEADRYIFSQDRPDLIVMDVMLPVLNGDKKARMLKENELTRDIPILLLSSQPENELRNMVRESGTDGFIRKPFTDREMVSKIEETLREKRGDRS